MIPAINTYADNLMLPVEQLRSKGITEEMIQRFIRLRDVYNYMLRNPLKKDKDYVDYIQSSSESRNGKPLSRRTAYEDLEILHAVVGNLQQCTKEWHRWRFNSMIMEGYAIAFRRGNAAAIARLAGQYGKYNQLDKNDERDNGLSTVPHLVFVFDVSVQGFKPIPNAYKVIDETISKYLGVMGDIAEDADAVEIANEPDSHGDPAAVSE